MCCSVLPSSVLQYVAARCSALQCVAVRCSALQCVAVCCNNTVISSNLAISTEQSQVKNASCNSYGITPETHKIPPISQKSVLQWFYICNWVANQRYEILYRKLYTRERGDQRRALHGIPRASLEEQMPMGVPHLVKRTHTISRNVISMYNRYKTDFWEIVSVMMLNSRFWWEFHF